MMPVPIRAAAEVIEALRIGAHISDDAMIQLLTVQRVPVRQKNLADGMHAAGVITADQRALVAYLFPQTTSA